MNRTATRAAATALACAAALPAAAQAHVTVQPRTAPAGAYTVLDVRVPNERDGKATTKIEMQLPPGFVAASFQPVPDWDVRVIRDRLSRPIQTENGPISEQVSEIVWSGGQIPPGAFQDFPISVQIPGRAGDTLTFKALQTYAGGEVVRWIGAPDSETPAAQVAVVAPDGEGEGAGTGHGAAGGGSDAAGASGGANANSASDYDLHLSKLAVDDALVDDDGASKGLAYAGLAAGIVGLLLGGAALLLTTRRRGDAPAA
jgi:uncharacterized protein YcnI